MKKIAIAGISGNTGNYHHALSQLGAVCTTLTDIGSTAQRNAAQRNAAQYSTAQFDALLLPGGGDIDPALFGETDHGSRSIDPVLDRQQLSMLDAFVKAGKPVLGICKGMQVINIYFGGRIIQDLPTNTLHQYTDQDQVHPSHALPGTILQKLYGRDFPVNSAHHQGIGSPGRDLFIIQYAPDDVPEAIIHKTLPILGVQWHPERMCFEHRRTDTPDGSLLLAHFLSLIP